MSILRDELEAWSQGISDPDGNHIMKLGQVIDDMYPTIKSVVVDELGLIIDDVANTCNVDNSISKIGIQNTKIQDLEDTVW